MVPRSLRIWFVLHFAADYLAAIPLMVAPVAVLSLLGWQVVDPLATRLVAAALFGIGGVSLTGRNADAPSFRHMLTMKLIWAGTAILGIAWSIIEGAPAAAWGFLVIFVLFGLLWGYYRVILGK